MDRPERHDPRPGAGGSSADQPNLFGDDLRDEDPGGRPAPRGGRPPRATSVEVAVDLTRDPEEAWADVRERARGCRNCDLWQHATQTVFGEGPVPARVAMVGEQPGDKEDRAGRPFVGPAGRVFDEALTELGVERGDLYVTNAVKHFKWTPSGSVRIHQSPNAREVKACAPWFEAELALVQPELLVCLGAVAAKALLGPQFRLTASRGTFVDSPLAPHVLATVHPSSILRTRDDRLAAMAAFVADLRVALSVLD